MEKKDKRKKILKVSGLIGLFLVVFGLSYALFTVTLNGTKKVKLKTGKLELQLLDANNNPIYVTGQNSESSYAINLDNQVPVSDDVGLATQAFEFKLKNTGNLMANYTIYLDDVALEEGESRIADQYIRYSLTKNGSEDAASNLTSIGENPDRTLDEGVIIKNAINTYTLKVWISENADDAAMDKVFNTTLRVEGTPFINNTPYEYGTFNYFRYMQDDIKSLNTPVKNGFYSDVEGSGLYKYSQIYVYRGTDVNNYVQFAGKLWRIISIDSNGNTKLITDDAIDYEISGYDNGSATSNNLTYRKVQYNKSSGNIDYTRYQGSNIKNYVDEWYNSVLEDNYDDMILSNDYCSDRYATAMDSTLRNQVFGGTNPLYGIFNRMRTTNISNRSAYEIYPSISCSEDDTVAAKAALITADEYILAGGGFGRGNSYLDKTYSYWTMSPEGDFHYNVYSYRVSAQGDLSYDTVSNSLGVRPVITLNANVVVGSGDGTSEHPYVID